MGRSDDPFWKEVEDMNDGRMKCKFCGHLFANGTSISRIKWHLSGERTHGVGICGQVPQEVQDAAFLAMRVGNKRHKSIASSSNVDISTCRQDQDNAVLGNLAQGGGPERIHSRLEAASGMEYTGEGSFQHVDRSVSPWRLRVDAHENRGEATPGTDLVDPFADYNWDQIHSTLSKEQKLNEIFTDLMQEDEDVERLHDAFETIPRTEQVQHLERGSSCERPSINQADEPRGDKSIASSSNVNDYAISTGLLEQNKAVLDNLAGDAGRIQAPDVTGQSIERSLDEICNLSTEDDIDNGNRGVVQPGAGASSFGGLTWNINEIKGDALPTTKLVGQEFEDHRGTIWRWLMNDEVSRIGIYGMGGVGKTTLVTHMYNQLLERPDTFCHVYWITVSQDTSISRLQNSIARCIGLDLSNEDEELHRAVKLSKELMKKKKWVLILDDLWKAFELHKLGVPIQVKGCKLILTTRSKKVCEQMDTQHIIKVKPVSEEEAWTLFIQRLGHVIAFSPEVEKIAKSITKECDGLPLGIITMAVTMKGVDDIHEWRNALEDLRQSRVRQDGMEEEVFRILRFSYTHLKDSALQQCLLYCALFPEGYTICRKDLVGYLIDEGVIKGLNSRVAEFDKGYSMLNSLENICLLERIDSDNVKMHHLIRDMAIQILQENSPGMFKADVQLKELPDTDAWTDNLTRVSLMYNKIEEIPSSHSPSCPNLSTLLLSCNYDLRFIAESFFKQLFGLKVLDLSYTNINRLPDAVSDLLTLTSLLLIACDKLRHLPSLEKLRALRRLDLYRTALEKMPQGMECLSNLRYLRMNGCGQREFPSGILPKLLHLQVFILEDFMPTAGRMDKQILAPVTVKGKEVACLRKLETLKCHFDGYSDFVDYLKYRDNSTQSPREYNFFVGDFGYDDYDVKRYYRCKSVWLGDLSIESDGDLEDIFPNDIQQLMIFYCDAATSLCNVSSQIIRAEKLEVINIKDCSNMEGLASSSLLRKEMEDLRSRPSSKGIFSGLMEFYCSGCNSMKKLFPIVLLTSLVNLEVIEVRWCVEMEEIIGTGSDEESSCSIIELKLPKLRILYLTELPKLKSIFSAELICDSLQQIGITNCEMLKKLGIHLPLLENGQLSHPPSLREMEIHPKEWWESVVEREHPNAKDVLRPLLFK